MSLSPDAIPVVSIVTPSFNQAEYLDRCVRSVVEQGYPRLEYVIIDGGSTDGSVDIIRQHHDQLSYSVSEPDNGMYDGLNKGFSRTSGEIMAWLNADDMYTPWAFSVVAEIFDAFPEIEWLSSAFPLAWDRKGRGVKCAHLPGFNRQAFYRGLNLPGIARGAHGFIQQESTFWRRSLWDRAGGQLDASLRLAADFDLWARFWQHADLYAVDVPLAGFRMHDNQKTARQFAQYLEEGLAVLRKHGGSPSGRVSAALRGLLTPRLPALAWPAAVALGLAYRGRLVTHMGRVEKWTVTQTPVF